MKRKTIKNHLVSRARFLELLHNFKKANVLVVGDFILDQFIWGQVERISPEAPVPVVQVDRDSYMVGGSLNVAHNISTLGGGVFPCGVVGRDLLGRMLLKAMRRQGVETGGVVYDSARPTTHKARVIAHSQQVVRFDKEMVGDIPANDRRRILAYAEKKMKDVQGIVIEDYGKGVVTPELIRGILSLSKKYRKFVIVDPKDRHFPYYKGVTVITPNRKEAYGGLGLEDRMRNVPIEEVGKRLLKKLNCQSVLVTVGEEGMILFEQKKGTCTHIPTMAREVYDVSGAGDTVVAVLALSLASGATMKEAAFLSNLASGVVVGKLGTATVSAEEITASYDETIRKDVRVRV